MPLCYLTGSGDRVAEKLRELTVAFFGQVLAVPGHLCRAFRIDEYAAVPAGDLFVQRRYVL